MKDVKRMSYKELENEVSMNREKMMHADLGTRRALVRRDHDLMVEMDSRWEQIKDWWKN